MDNQQSTERVRETDDVRAFLEAYRILQRRIDNTERRIEALELSMGTPSGPNLSGMPSGGRGDSSKVEREVIRKAELEDRIRTLYAEENRHREEIEDLIDRLERPEQQTAIEMRYIDGARWDAVSAALYSDEADYEQREQKYLKRTFKVHGAALLALARIYNNDKG